MSRKVIRVLVVESNPVDYEIIRTLFSQVQHGRYELENAKNLSEGLKKLHQGKHDAYLVDHQLGADSGMDFLRYAIQQEKCQAPVILMTGIDDYKSDIEAMELGAADFLNMSQLNSDFLERAVRYALTRKRAEESQSQLTAILQQSAVAIVGFDLKGKVTNWNQGAEIMFGYSFDEMKGQMAISLVHADELAENRKIWNKTIEKAEVNNHEEKWVKKNGEQVHVSITLTPIRNLVNKIAGGSIIARDISYRKRVEETLKQQEEQLRLSQKMDAIGRLAGGVAHDFNNLLSVIGGNVEFLLGDLEKEGFQNEELLEIQKAVRQGAELTKQLLVFGRKQVSQPQAVNLNEINAEMNKMFKRLIDASIDLSYKQEKDLKPILADPGQIQQVILNLVLNARDAMPRGGSLIIETVNVEVGPLEKGREDFVFSGKYVQLNVTDTGIGMSPEIQAHIFEPFFTTKEGKGTGLGLASVYAIVKKWNGAIFVHSFSGVGTTFSLRFPALDRVEEIEVEDKQDTMTATGTETILVAEDEEPVRKLLVRALEKYGYKVLQAGDGLEGLQIALDYQGRIDLLLTDTIMPRMNGKQLADELKKSRSQVKVVFISGYTAEVLSQQGILDSKIRLIQKPFELDYLVKQVRKVLDEPRPV
jgi:two-component system cell cycle sensor histidine kinase/response regulator CckA